MSLELEFKFVVGPKRADQLRKSEGPRFRLNIMWGMHPDTQAIGWALQRDGSWVSVYEDALAPDWDHQVVHRNPTRAAVAKMEAVANDQV